MTSDFQHNQLDNLGFPNTRATDNGFYAAPGKPSTDVVNIYNADGDTANERVTLLTTLDEDAPNGVAVTAVPATDICPRANDDGLTDPDGDGLFGACDPEPLFRNVYVAGGDATRPAMSATQALKAHRWRTTSQVSHGGGFLDRDGDGYVEGEDMCPNVPDSSSYMAGRIGNGNTWGEGINFPRADSTQWASVAAAETEIKTLGAYYRGNTCDPYPTSLLTWKPPQPVDQNNNACKIVGHKTVGFAATPPITTARAVGISDNDTTSTIGPRTYNVQNYRCRCVGNGCMSDNGDPCYAANAVVADAFAPTGAGWRPIEEQGCSKASNGFCSNKKATIKPRSVSSTSQVKWDWANEYQKSQQSGFMDKHFASGDCGTVSQAFDTSDDMTPGATGQTTLSHSSCGQYALWSRVENGESFSSAPGVGMTPAANQPPFVHYQEPENLAQGQTKSLGNYTSLASSRLRSDFAGPRTIETSQTHTYPVGGQACYNFGPVSLAYLSLLWLVDPCPDCPLAFSHPGDIYEVSGVFGPLVTNRLFTRASLEKGYARLSLDATVPSWVSSAQGVSTTLTAPGQSGVIASRVLFVETGVAQPRWALLQATGEDSTTRTFALSQQGNLFQPLTSSVELMGDALGTTAALVERTTGRVVAFDAAAGQWIEAPALPLSPALATASLLLTGPRLMATSPTTSGTATDVQYVDIGGTARSAATLALPGRRGARLQLASDHSTVLSVGGIDRRGNMHDDVWALHLDGPTPSVSLLRADTAQAASFEPTRSVVIGSPNDADLRAWLAPGGSVTSLQKVSRDERGWHDLDGLGQPLEPSCGPSDTQAGLLCPVSADWHATPGALSCAQGAQPGVCQGAPGAVRWTASLPTRTTSVAAGFESLWRLTGNVVELWSASEHTTPTLLAQSSLPSSSSEVVARGNEALVLSVDGVRSVRRSATGVSLSAVTALCGRPLHATSLGDGRWLVATTLGHSLVSTADSATPAWLASFLLSTTASGQLTMQATTSAALTQCQSQDAALSTAQVSALRTSTALAAGDAARVIASWAGTAFWLNVQVPSAPVVSSSVAVSGSLTSWRLDDRSGRLYGVRTLSGGALDPVTLDTRAGLTIAPAHTLTDWVRRSDHEGLQALRRSDGGVDVAWGVR